MIQKTDSSLLRVTLLCASAFLAGFLNGLLGTGGGMILIFVLGFLLRGGREKEAFVISSVGVLVFSAFSAALYGSLGQLDTALLPRLALPAAAGGLFGAWLLDRISILWLRRLFALLVLSAGLKMTGVI